MTEIINTIKSSINLLNEQSLKAKENDEIKRIIYIDGQIEAYTQCLTMLQAAKTTDMTKQEAVDAMLLGKKVRHKTFLELDGFLENKESILFYKTHQTDFIQFDGVQFNAGWEIYNEVPTLEIKSDTPSSPTQV